MHEACFFVTNLLYFLLISQGKYFIGYKYNSFKLNHLVMQLILLIVLYIMNNDISI